MNKIDLMIVYEDENRYIVFNRIKVFYFFNKWVKLTYQEAEHTEDLPLVFETFNEANDFINKISD